MSITISFAKPEDVLRFMTERRLRLLRAVRKHPGSIKELASSVHRKPDAVAKDLRLLEEAGLVIIRKVLCFQVSTNPAQSFLPADTSLWPHEL